MNNLDRQPALPGCPAISPEAARAVTTPQPRRICGKKALDAQLLQRDVLRRPDDRHGREEAKGAPILGELHQNHRHQRGHQVRGLHRRGTPG